MKNKQKKSTEEENTPPPGSQEAIKLGCRCPVLDNGRGKGYLGIEGMYIYNSSCEVHKIKRPENDEQS